MDALADARRAWVAHLAQAEERRSAEKPTAPAPPRLGLLSEWHNEWLELYLTGEMAARWMVTGLVVPGACNHSLMPLSVKRGTAELSGRILAV